MFRLSSGDGVWNLFKEITTTSQRQEISDWYHLKENLYKVGGERQRIKQAEALLWRDRVEDAIALFDNCHSRQAITGLTQLAHGDRYDRPNPITVTDPIGLPVDKQSKTWC